MSIILLEKKTDLVDPSKVVIPANYLLVLPDKNHEFYHDKDGNETDLMVGTSFVKDMAEDDDLNDRPQERVDTLAQHYSVRGKVYAIPQKLRFLRKEIDRFKGTLSHDDLPKLTQAMEASVEYDTDIEVEVGDEVIFDYLAHIGCYDEGRWIETELGDMFLIRYDEIHMRIDSDGNKHPINGWMVITREEMKEQLESGLYTPPINQEKITSKAFGYVIHQGKPLRGTKERLYEPDDTYDFKEGQRILYRPGGSRPLEWVLHQTLYPNKKALLIHRKDVFYAEEYVS